MSALAPAPVRIPVAPLVEAVRTRGTTIGRNHPVSRAYWRATARGSITVDSADEVAVNLLGVHPASVWPDWFELAL